MSPNTSAKLRAHLRLAEPGPVAFQRRSRESFGAFDRELLHYDGLEGDEIPAFLFLPVDREPAGGVVVFHQHNGEFHLGKSEVAGDAGAPLQAFGPALAMRGVAVLAPDAVAFEDRRAPVAGHESDENDWSRHYNSLAYRIVDGDTLMRKVLDDSQRALTVLGRAVSLAGKPVGVLGHSFGGLVALYLAALDVRCKFVCSSGAVSSFESRRNAGTGINMFEVVPGLQSILETSDLLASIAPRPVLVVSSTQDPYSVDADDVVAAADSDSISHVRAEGAHELDQSRFDAILDWVVTVPFR